MTGGLRLSEVENAVVKWCFSFCPNRISGGAASDKNIKENVCAQIEKNFARAKWKVKVSDFFYKKSLVLQQDRGSLFEVLQRES